MTCGRDFGVEVAEVGQVLDGSDHDVAVAVRVEVHDHERKVAPVEDQPVIFQRLA